MRPTSNEGLQLEPDNQRARLEGDISATEARARGFLPVFARHSWVDTIQSAFGALKLQRYGYDLVVSRATPCTTGGECRPYELAVYDAYESPHELLLAIAEHAFQPEIVRALPARHPVEDLGTKVPMADLVPDFYEVKRTPVGNGRMLYLIRFARAREQLNAHIRIRIGPADLAAMAAREVRRHDIRPNPREHGLEFTIEGRPRRITAGDSVVIEVVIRNSLPRPRRLSFSDGCQQPEIVVEGPDGNEAAQDVCGVATQAVTHRDLGGRGEFRHRFVWPTTTGLAAGEYTVFAERKLWGVADSAGAYLRAVPVRFTVSAPAGRSAAGTPFAAARCPRPASLSYLRPVPKASYIVLTRPEAVDAIIASYAITPSYVYRHALDGFSAVLSEDDVARLRCEADVVRIQQDF